MHDVSQLSPLLMRAFEYGNIAISCGMPEQRAKVVNFDICKWPPKLTSYHSNAH